MLDRLKKFVEQYDLFQPHHRLLVAVSGGVDSVTLTHLLSGMGNEIGLAHVNFNLRGADSQEDAHLVSRLGESLKYPVYIRSCDAASLARESGQSVQMAAREYRYQWFEALRQRENFDFILLGHHLQDSVETVLHHFARGTGLRGLHGIPIRNGRLLRPLLFATRREIEAYAEQEGISYREDASNHSLYYTRNLIRREVLSAFQRVNPSFMQAAAGNIQRIQEAEYLMNYALRDLRALLITTEGDRMTIQLEGLLQHYQAAGTILYEWLNPYGFNAAQVKQMLESAGRQPGGRFFSPSHRLLIDREHLILEPIPLGDAPGPYFLHQEAEAVFLPDGSLHLEWKEGRPDFFSPDPHQASLDIPPQAFPLRVRHWQAGDAFCPLGMDGKHQKIQDFFTNQKIPRTEKGRIWLVETGKGEICWIVGYRIDERFRINQQTDGYVRLHFKPLETEEVAS